MMKTRRSTATTTKLTKLALPVLCLATIFLVSLISFSISSRLRSLESSNPVTQSLQTFADHGSTGRTAEHNHPPVHKITYPVEEPIPNPEPADGQNTFAACLLVMDDNHRLIEWLAYHWHVLPLRYLLVTVDPRSKTSPSSIFNRWRRHGMYIKEWTDRDFWRKDLKLVPIEDSAEFQTKRDRHRGRQKYFYRKCLIDMKKNNRTWVSLHDTDEYMVYNHAGGDLFDAWEERMAQRQPDKKRVRPSKAPPTTAEAGGMIRYIRQEQAAGLEYYQSPCIGIPRLQYSAAETLPEVRNRNVPAGFDPEQLDTMRWVRHAERNDFVKNALGKVILDVSRIDVAGRFALDSFL